MCFVIRKFTVGGALSTVCMNMIHMAINRFDAGNISLCQATLSTWGMDQLFDRTLIALKVLQQRHGNVDNKFFDEYLTSK